MERTMRNSIRRSVWTAVALGLFAAHANAEVVVIVNPKNPAASLTPQQVAALYLGNATTFPSGRSAGDRLRRCERGRRLRKGRVEAVRYRAFSSA
jgi:hypothetical protein